MPRHIDFDSELTSLERAINQGIKAERQDDGTYLVLSSNGVDSYHISHNMCTCTGYWRWHYCKHIALVHVLQKEAGDIVLCPICGKHLLIHPPMSADEWSNLH